MKKLLSTVALVCFLLIVLVFVCWMNFISYITAGNLIKTKIYVFIHVLWNTYLLSSFSPLFFSFVFFFLLFFSVFTFFSVLFFIFFEPKLFYQYLFESIRKQQLRGILLNMYVFNLINFTKLRFFLAIFVSTQETFQCGLSVVVRVIWLRDVGQCQSNVETTLRMSALRFTTLSNVKSTLSISTLILTTSDNVKIMPLFWTSSFITLINVETTLWIWPFSKSWKEQKNIFKLQKKDDSFD